MTINLQVATAGDVRELAALHNKAAERLTGQYGQGLWSAKTTEKSLLWTMKVSTTYIVRTDAGLIATLSLSERKPWAIDKTFFSVSRMPLYLTGMAVNPDEQRKGIGKLCLDEARRIAAKWPSDAIRLDAWDAAAGAGDFYRRCGFREVGRVTYRGAPLIYFEWLM
ncbi:MAG TPA: GNAT family N-acetyltransferase [Bryobacteraceae bacterium]|jgi:GNAT superfamily N-acetyltransferase